MQRITFVAVTLIAVVCASPIEKTQVERQVLIDSDIDSKQATYNYRLGDEVSPTFYDILLKPYFADEGLNKAFTFTGQVKITVRAEKIGVSSIVLHANQLDIKDTWRVYPKNNNFQFLQKPPFQYDNVTHLLTLPLIGVITQGVEYILEFDYTGYLKDDMHGFYRSSYMENGQKK
jgi:aminopeptidase N